MSTEQVLFDIRASDETAQAFHSAEKALKDLSRASDNFNKVAVDSIKVDKQRLASIEAVVAAAYEEAMTFGYSAREMAIYNASMAGATKSQLEHINISYDVIEAKRREAQAQRLAGNAAVTGVGQVQAVSRSSRAAVQQLGFQIQDIAVQLQGGTNPFTVLSQQGSQIAGIFGPGGAVAGAFIAIGGVIAGSLLPGLFKAKEATDSLAESTRKLTEDLKFASDAQRDYVLATEESARKTLADELDRMNKEFLQLTDARVALESALADPAALARSSALTGVDPTGTYLQRVEAIREREAELLVEIANKETELSIDTAKELLATEEMLSKLFAGIEDERLKKSEEVAKQRIDTELILANTFAGFEQKRVEDASRAANERIAIEQMLFETFQGFEQKRAEERAKLETGVSGITQSLMTETQQIEATYASQLAIIMEAQAQNIEAEMEYSEILIGLAAWRADRIMEIEQKIQDDKDALQQTANDAFLANMNRQVDILQGAFDQQTALGKAFFLFQQSMAAANAIVNGYDAAMKIKAAMPIGGDAMAAASIAMGFASAGAILGQTIGSFEGGGFTGYGARSGGLDGKGGKLAMVHPNETIIDHEKEGFSPYMPEIAGMDQIDSFINMMANSGGSDNDQSKSVAVSEPVTVNINISTMDKRGVSDFFEQNRPFIYREVRNAMMDRGRSL